MGLMGRFLSPVPVEVLESLVTQYQNAGLTAQLLPKDSDEAIGGRPVIRVGGRNIDLVHVTFARGFMGPMEKTSTIGTITKKKETASRALWFHHMVRGLPELTDEELKTELKAEKKGMVRKKLVDVRWEGALAEKLNSDADLKKKLLGSGTDNVKIEPDKKNDCIKITLQKRIDMITETKGMFSRKKEIRVEKLPSMDAFDAMDIIAGYARSA